MKKLFTNSWPARARALYVCCLEGSMAGKVNVSAIQNCLSGSVNYRLIKIRLNPVKFHVDSATNPAENALLTYSTEIAHTYTTSTNFSFMTDVKASALLWKDTKRVAVKTNKNICDFRYSFAGPGLSGLLSRKGSDSSGFYLKTSCGR